MPQSRFFSLHSCLAVLVFTAVMAAGAVPARAADSPPNILLCIADDWSYPHTSAYGDPVARTPNFDRAAEQGILFTHAFCAAPSCTPSRAALLSGKPIHQLGPTGNLWSRLPEGFVGYPDLLEQAGYIVGLQGKGWGPGTIEGSGRKHNPAGKPVKSFAQFLESVPDDAPFCFWFGSSDPHRPYDAGPGDQPGRHADRLVVPPFLPDTPEVRADLLDYLEEVERFDRQVGELLQVLEESGRAENTLVIITSDNGMPFPRAKTNLYDAGARMPLVMRWPAQIPAGQKTEALVSLIDLAPTILEAAKVNVPDDMVGRSLLTLATTRREEGPREQVFIERERHANVRRGDLSYPARAVRTEDWLYIRNLRPDRWPAGDPELYHSVGPFGDIDGGPSKDELLAGRDGTAEQRRLFELAAGKRPAEELYDCQRDPWQMKNLAADPAHAEVRAELRQTLDEWMQQTGDPRAAPDGGDDGWDEYEYVGPPVKRR